ncbi:MAG: protoglobin domain-containing protein [Hydrogenobaculum sp.]
MRSIEEIKKHYSWNEEDERHLKEMKDIAIKHKDDFVNKLYEYFNIFEDKDRYLKDEKIKERHKAHLQAWFLGLFEGNIDHIYISKVQRIGMRHVQIGLPPHYLNSSMNFVREFIETLVIEKTADADEKIKILKSIDKILDINLDVITEAYREEEFKTYLGTSKIQKIFIEAIQGVSRSIDLFIVTIMSFLAIAGGGWILYELVNLVLGRVSPESTALEILGSTLILYAISELLNEELKHLKGASLSLKVFAGIALAAIIRKILIISLYPKKSIELLILGILMLFIGIVYFIINKVEKK